MGLQDPKRKRREQVTTEARPRRNIWKWIVIIGAVLTLLFVLLVGACGVLLFAAGSGQGGDQGIEQAGSGASGFKADKRCQMNRPCDLGPGKVTVEKATATNFIDISFDKPIRSAGEFVVVNFSYVSDRNQPVSPVYESPFVLVDSRGRTFNEDFDATGDVAIDRDIPIGGMDSNDIQPGSPTEGVSVFDVPTKDTSGFKLRLVDPVEPNVGKSAEMPLDVTKGQY